MVKIISGCLNRDGYMHLYVFTMNGQMRKIGDGNYDIECLAWTKPLEMSFIRQLQSILMTDRYVSIRMEDRTPYRDTEGIEFSHLLCRL